MARQVNQKCLQCASESIEIARSKPCWERSCHNRRSYYRRRDTFNAERKSKRSQTKKIAVPQPELPPYAILYVERSGGAKDSKIVGMYAKYFEGGRVVVETEPFRDRALPSMLWKQYASNILKTLQGQYPSLKGFVERVDVNVLESRD